MKKRFMSALAALLLYGTNSAVYPAIAADATIKGDANGDGIVSVADLVTLQGWLVGKSNAMMSPAAADMNGDGNIDTFDLVAMRRYFVENSEDNPIPEPVFITFDFLDEYEDFVETKDLNGKMVTYDQIMHIGAFESFTFHSPDPYNYAYISYSLNDGSGKNVYLNIIDLTMVDLTPENLPELGINDVDRSDMRTTRAKGACKVTFGDMTYIYCDGKLIAIRWYDDTHEYTLSGSSNLADYPLEADTYTASLLCFEIEEDHKPIYPTCVPAQPVPFTDTAALINEIGSYDLGNYNDIFYEDYRRMFETMKNSKFYAVKTDDKLTVMADTTIYACPYAKYEDIGVFDYLEYDSKKYRVAVFYADSDIAAECDSYAEYNSRRFGFKLTDIIDLYGKEVCMGKYNDLPCASGMIDDLHYFTVYPLFYDAAEDDLLHLVNRLEFEEMSINK